MMKVNEIIAMVVKRQAKMEPLPQVIYLMRPEWDELLSELAIQPVAREMQVYGVRIRLAE